jgi:hypothetical protein
MSSVDALWKAPVNEVNSTDQKMGSLALLPVFLRRSRTETALTVNTRDDFVGR